DQVLAAMVDLRRLAHVVRLAVHPQPLEPHTANLVPELLVLLLPAPLDRGEQKQARSLRQMVQLLDDLVRRLRADRDLAGRAMRVTETGEKDAQVVVDLGDGADRRARTLARRLLLDADRR